MKDKVYTQTSWKFEPLTFNVLLCNHIIDKHNTMVNVTTRIAVEIAHLPPFQFSWSDSTPQKPRSKLVAADILPTSTDGKQMFDRATEFIMRFLTENFPTLENLKEILPPAQSTSSQEKSTIVPMPIMQRDEKYTDDTIKILHDFKSDCNLTGEPHIQLGTYMHLEHSYYK